MLTDFTVETKKLLKMKLKNCVETSNLEFCISAFDKPCVLLFDAKRIQYFQFVNLNLNSIRA